MSSCWSTCISFTQTVKRELVSVPEVEEECEGFRGWDERIPEKDYLATLASVSSDRTTCLLHHISLVSCFPFCVKTIAMNVHVLWQQKRPSKRSSMMSTSLLRLTRLMLSLVLWYSLLNIQTQLDWKETQKRTHSILAWEYNEEKKKWATSVDSGLTFIWGRKTSKGRQRKRGRKRWSRAEGKEKCMTWGEKDLMDL